MLVDKLNEFKTAIDAIKVALVAQGVAVSAYTLASAAQLVGQVQTSRSMGSQEVTFKQNIIIYGIKITESEADPEKRVAYLDNAKGMVPVAVDLNNTGEATYNGWDKTWIFERIKPCMLKSNGKVDYYLDPNDQTKKKGGGTSDIGNINYQGDAMVEFSKFFIKFSMDGEDEIIQIADKEIEGFEPIGFYREDGSIADNFYRAMFLNCHDQNGNPHSISGQNLYFDSSNHNSIRAAIKRRGEDYDMESWAMNQLLQALFLILFKNCYAIKIMGTGRDKKDNNSLPKSGNLINRGAIYADPETKTTKFLWIEDIITSGTRINSSTLTYLSRIETGIGSYEKKLCLSMKPPYNSNFENYLELDYEYLYPSKSVKKMKCDNSYGRIPVNSEDNTSSSNKYSCCLWEVFPTNYAFAYYNGSAYYFFGRGADSFNDNSNRTFISSLTYLPPA